MKEMRDPAIKLFGKEITVVENCRIPVKSGGDCTGDYVAMSDCFEDEKVREIGKKEQGKGGTELEADKDSQYGTFPRQEPNDFPHPMEEESLEENPRTPNNLDENASGKQDDETENDQENDSSENKPPLKKPDKILPCPRCNSMETKFCYYNNYNVNQPRHFCKSCQRYWTAGGTMRNVPVGAGRRKNKNSPSSHCRHVTISEALQMDSVYGTNGSTVLSFGSEKNVSNGVFRNKQNGSDCSSGSSVITSNSVEPGIRNPPGPNGYNMQVPCLQGFPWPYPVIPSPGLSPQPYPIPIYPIPYWNCSVPAGTWPVPWISPPCGTTNPKPQNPSPMSPLGKHSRNGNLIRANNVENNESDQEPRKSLERSILIPKTLRIDDPDEAAKSSIWQTLGIKNETINRKDFFKAFESKSIDEKKNYIRENSSLMLANPAAMSRSLKFQEAS